jgi:DNA-binding PadR family transcriptional regulator
MKVLRGILDLLILKATGSAPMHRDAMAQWMERVTNDAPRIEEGALSPALHALAVPADRA